mgnify:CR=1 FL=1|jgi:hypothetical protein
MALRKSNQQLIKSVYEFQKLYKEIVLEEHEKIVQEVNLRNQRLNASERRDDEYMEMISEYSMEPTTSFNQNGAHSMFQEVFRVLIGMACKLFKEQEKYLEMFRTLSLNDVNKKRHKES